jgi:hypothetical protein
MNWARAYVGLVIVAVGTILLLGNADVLDAGDVIASWWPAPIVLGGVLSLVSNPRHWIPPLIIIAIGTALLLRTTGAVDTMGVVFPVALILIGVLVIFGRGFGPRREHTESSVNAFNLFSGSELASHSTAFEGGKVGAVFGGSEIDLRDATLAPGASPHNPKVAGSNPAPATKSPGQCNAGQGFYRSPAPFYRGFYRFFYRLPAISFSKTRAASACIPGSTCW